MKQRLGLDQGQIAKLKLQLYNYDREINDYLPMEELIVRPYILRTAPILFFLKTVHFS